MNNRYKKLAILIVVLFVLAVLADRTKTKILSAWRRLKTLQVFKSHCDCRGKIKDFGTAPHGRQDRQVCILLY